MGVQWVQGLGLVRGVPRPLIVDESFARQLGVLVRRIKIWKHRRV